MDYGVAALLERVGHAVSAAVDSRLGLVPEKSRMIEAGSDAATPERLPTLARDSSIKVRRTVAWNLSTAPEIVRDLAGDESEEVRKSAAGNHRLPQVALERLGADPSAAVRGTALFNPAMPEAVLVRLVCDEDRLVRWAAASVLATRTDREGERGEAARNGAVELFGRTVAERAAALREAQDPGAAPDSLAALGSDPDPVVRGAVADNPSTAAGLLKRMATDRDWTVRLNVALNPATDREALLPLVQDQAWWVRSTAMARHANPPR